MPDCELCGEEQGVPPYDGLHQIQGDVLKLITLQHLARRKYQTNDGRSQKQTVFLRSKELNGDFSDFQKVTKILQI